MAHTKQSVWGVGAVQDSIRLKIYRIMDIKYPDYVMLMMTTYGTLEHLVGPDTPWGYKGAGVELVTKGFNYLEVFGNQLNYRHQVDDNNNRHHFPFSV